MADTTANAPEPLRHPHVRLTGDFDAALFQSLRDQIERSGDADPLVIEVTTVGGDAEIGRRAALELRLLREAGRRVLFLGKTAVYSAGVTMLAAAAVEDRWLTADTLLLIHGRKLSTPIELTGHLRDAKRQAERALAQIVAGLEVEEQGFAELAQGSRLSFQELCERATGEWYVTAREAVDLGLVAGIFGPPVATG